MKKFHFLLLALFASSVCNAANPDHPHVQYGSDAQQWLDIYIAPSTSPTPVYFDAHGNGGNTNMPNSIVDALKAEGISIIAWESLTAVNTPAQVDTGWTDAELMFAWVKDNAETYNFDTTNLIIGGSSRGSILSWKYGHRSDPNIKGLYMYNALPDAIWADSTWWYPLNEVTVESPPIFFVYKYEPGVTFDGHDPDNGIMIMDTYEALGIGDKDTLVHSIAYSSNDDKYQFLVDFILSVIDTNPVLSLNSNVIAGPIFTAFPNPFRDKLEISGLTGRESFSLSGLHGGIIKREDTLDALHMTELIPGVYFLTIQSKDGQSVLKLIKN